MRGAQDLKKVQNGVLHQLLNRDGTGHERNSGKRVSEVERTGEGKYNPQNVEIPSSSSGGDVAVG